MGPEFYVVLRANVVRVAHTGDVRMQGLKIGLDSCQNASYWHKYRTDFGMFRAHRHGLGNLKLL